MLDVIMISMDFIGFQWILDGFQWILMEFNGFQVVRTFSSLLKACLEAEWQDKKEKKRLLAGPVDCWNCSELLDWHTENHLNALKSWLLSRLCLVKSLQSLLHMV